MERVAGPQLFISCGSHRMPVSKTDEGSGVRARVGVGGNVASGVIWVGIPAGSAVGWGVYLSEGVAASVEVAPKTSSLVDGTNTASLGGLIQYLTVRYTSLEW